MQTKQDDFKIDLSFPTKEFKKHLALEDNQRIIFSGPFGSGKTYFLKDFFEQEKERYHFIRLAPVNYSVAQNEDIFELIKFDILFHLLAEELFPKDLGLSKDFILKHLSLLDPEKGLKGILEKANQTGTGNLSLLKELEGVFEGTELPSLDSNSPQGLTELIGFLEKITRERGSVNEQNVLTQLLYYLVSKILASGKEVVLIIDDLDRIDPEHIFRILNVFAAHFDLDSKENKFGFNRVILVCDLDNVRRAFANRYGQDVDFSGYIDKFYSRDVFCFDNTKSLIKEIKSILSSLKVTSEDGQSWFHVDRATHDQDFVAYILTGLILVNSTNLRSISRIRNKPFTVKTTGGHEGKKFPLIWAIEIVRMIVGDGISLYFGIKKCVFAKIWLELVEGVQKTVSIKIF